MGLKTYAVPEQPVQAVRPKALATGNTAKPSGSAFEGEDDYASAGAPVVGEGEEGSWPSESAEASAMSDVRERGEDTVIISALSKVEEETVKKTLPPLEQLMPKVPEPIKETLEELFRAKWTRVMRVKKRDLTNP